MKYKIYRMRITQCSIHFDLYDEINRINFELYFSDSSNGMKAYKSITNFYHYQYMMNQDVNPKEIIEGFHNAKIALNQQREKVIYNE